MTNDAAARKGVDGKQLGEKKMIKRVRKPRFPGGEDRERVQEEEWICQNLKAIRMRMGFTQLRMGEKLMMDQSTYCLLEHGRRSLKINTLSYICDRLGISMAELVSPPKTKTIYGEDMK